MIPIDFDDSKQVSHFLLNNYLLKLNVYETKEKEQWKSKALQVLDDHEMQNQYGNSEAFSSIYFNSIQGKNLNSGIHNSLETHNVLMFIVSKQTHRLGKFLTNEFDCDFMLLKFEVPYENVKFDLGEDVKMDGVDLEALALSRELNINNATARSSMTEQQLNVMKEERDNFEEETKTLKEEHKSLAIELETANKSIADKERNIR